MQKALNKAVLHTQYRAKENSKQLSLLRITTIGLFILHCVSSNFVFASRPPFQKNADACSDILTSAVRAQLPSASTLIPVSVLLDSMKSDFIATLWRRGSIYSKQMPSAGLSLLFRSAKLSAEELVEDLNIKVESTAADFKNPWQAAAKTLELIESDNQPEYIREAVLIRENVVITVPLLKRVPAKSSVHGGYMYVPIIAKGHQDLRLNDKLTAAFAAWALEPWQGQFTPAQVKKDLDLAHVHLRPMVEKRTAVPELRANYSFRASDYFAQVQTIYERFMQVAEKATKMSDQEIEQARPERRWGECARSPWGAYCRAQLAKASDISMMPLPPTKEQSRLLNAFGYERMEQMAAIPLGGSEFSELCIKAAIDPERLWYFIVHARATTQKRPILSATYTDPTYFNGKSIDEIVHIDFEDVLQPDLRSGVYLMGVALESANTRAKTGEVDYTAFLAKKLSTVAIDKNWHDLLSFFKTHPRLKNKNYIITTYSKHERVKLEQQFDILKQDPSHFTKVQRRSEFYQEIETNGKTEGWLIRNTSFFEKYNDIDPSDIFTAARRMVDLLEYPRKHFSFPSYSNSIKQVTQYTGGNLNYDSGQNGLESMDWAYQAYQTNDPVLFEKMIRYNQKDVFGNQEVFRFLRDHANKEIDPDAKLELTEPELAKLKAAAHESRKNFALQEKRALLETIMGKSIQNLSQIEIETLKQIVNRTSYLKNLKDVDSDHRTARRRDTQDADERAEAKKQFYKFTMETSRQGLLLNFFELLNPELKASLENGETTRTTEALAKLFSLPTAYLTPSHIDEILDLK